MLNTGRFLKACFPSDQFYQTDQGVVKVLKANHRKLFTDPIVSRSGLFVSRSGLFRELIRGCL
jgi:hypothetical protein